MVVDGGRCPSLNQAMRILACFVCVLVLVSALTGCARRYTITTNSGRQITTKGKPKYDEENGVFRYTDVKGEKRAIGAGSVSEVSPGAKGESKTGFNPEMTR
jgi:hypothetical protein